jgi:hypothetical protein
VISNLLSSITCRCIWKSAHAVNWRHLYCNAECILIIPDPLCCNSLCVVRLLARWPSRDQSSQIESNFRCRRAKHPALPPQPEEYKNSTQNKWVCLSTILVFRFYSTWMDAVSVPFSWLKLQCVPRMRKRPFKGTSGAMRGMFASRSGHFQHLL